MSASNNPAGATSAAAAVILRLPRASDRDRVREIVEATGVFRPDETPIALEVFDTAVRAPGTDYWAVGAYVSTRMAGFAVFGPVPCTLATWDLYWIAVDPAAQGMGIGRRLMAHCEEAIVAEGGRLIVVETSSRHDYAATRAFYQRLGYEAGAAIPEYYAPGDALIVFTKYLRPSASE
ncbi:MAG: GNAT family N-acetyltransferase [Gemmatimonadota bacterium]|nr:GNAT family N-acetyltransferase [Gemmatimonadota bacterium]